MSLEQRGSAFLRRGQVKGKIQSAMMRSVAALVSVFFFLFCGSARWFFSTQVHAGPGEPTKDLLFTNARLNETSRTFRYRSDHDRDPFLPKSVFQNNAGSSLQRQDMSHQPVKVVGIMSSAQGHWAVLDFEDGERLIVRVGQVLSAYSQVVKRITDEGVILSAVEGKARVRSQPERTYLLYEERDFFEPYSRENS